MRTHSLADLIPPMSDQEFTELKRSIDAQGLIEPITIYDDQVLDGRHRYRACRELGIEPKTTIFRDGGDEDAALKFVIAKNIARRHLTESQRAMVAAAIANREVGSNQHRKKGGPIDPPSISKAAAMMKVSAKSVKRAKQVQAKGAPELAKAVTDGEIKVSAAAKIAALPGDEQRRIAAEKDPRKRCELIEKLTKARAAARAATEKGSPHTTANVDRPDRGIVTVAERLPVSLRNATARFITEAEPFDMDQRASAISYALAGLDLRDAFRRILLSVPIGREPTTKSQAPSPCQCEGRGLNKIACLVLDSLHRWSPMQRTTIRLSRVRQDRVYEALDSLLERGHVEKMPRRGYRITEAGKQVHAAKFEAARAKAIARKAAMQRLPRLDPTQVVRAIEAAGSATDGDEA
jgi:ParB-like chromosome segregation protein Spo0J